MSELYLKKLKTVQILKIFEFSSWNGLETKIW